MLWGSHECRQLLQSFRTARLDLANGMHLKTGWPVWELRFGFRGWLQLIILVLVVLTARLGLIVVLLVAIGKRVRAGAEGPAAQASHTCMGPSKTAQ